MQLSTKCVHIGANVNHIPHCLQFLDDDIIVYLARNQVNLYSMASMKVLMNLNTRSANLNINRGNCLHCIEQKYIIVGYDSGHIVIFSKKENTDSKETEWEISQIEKHSGPILGISHLENNIIIWNADAQVYLYQWKQGKITESNLIRFPLNKMIETVSIVFAGEQILAFMAGIDQKIHCYSIKESEFVYNFGLSGHENAITALAITSDSNDYLLASSSKDGYIRIWKLTSDESITKYHKNVSKVGKIFVFLDAVLISHESSVTSLRWVHFGNRLQLASCSIDCTICLWGQEQNLENQPEKQSQNVPEDSMWSVENRMGQFLGNKNAYFHIEADPKYEHLVVVNYIGSALIWKYSQNDGKFTLQPNFTGHSDYVTDLDWDSTGNFLTSVSKDQTTRILCRNSETKNYHEISRAQIHGYDINSVVMVQVDQGIIDLLACGADEKVIRIVEPPASFANYLNEFTRANLHLYFPSKEEEQKYIVSAPGEVLQYETYAEGGQQVLGLMTKMQRVEREKISSYYDDEEEQPEEEENNENQEKKEVPKLNYNIPPHDDYLVKHTLWPEMNKLYGHPQEISTLAKSNQRKILASACKGKNKKFCMIIIWNTQDWKIQHMIEFHQYTVHGLEFSHNGQLLASVSKDRQLAVWDSKFEKVFSYEAHSRAITSVAFSPNDQLLVTGGRDKTVRIHSINECKQIAEIDLKKEVHSVTFCGNEQTIAVGLLDGTIYFLAFNEGKLTQIHKIEDKYSPTFTVTRMRYNNGLLACSSEDHSVRIFEVSQKSEK